MFGTGDVTKEKVEKFSELEWSQIIVLAMYNNGQNKLYETNEIYHLPEIIKYIKSKPWVKEPNSAIRSTLQSHTIQGNLLIKNSGKSFPLFDCIEENGKYLWRISKDGIEYVENNLTLYSDINQVEMNELNYQSEKLSYEYEIEQDDAENEPLNLDVRTCKIEFDKYDPNVKTLLDCYLEGDLILHPPYQRNYVWDKQKASNLIESLLLNVPIPIVFTAEDGDKEEVIDGQQRLTSIFSFVLGKLPDGKVFKLSPLKILTHLSGKTYAELDETYQKQINKRTIVINKIKSSSNEDIKFEMFERLNTNITKLNAQELRNCMYRGSLNDRIKELAQYQPFQQLTTTQNDRMTNEELVLMFATFISKDYHQYKGGGIKRYLNEYMCKNRYAEKQELAELEKQFKKSVDLTKHVFGDTAFRIFSFYKDTDRTYFDSRKINQGLYLIIMYWFSIYEKNQVTPYGDLIREEMLNLQTSNAEFINSLTGSGTNSKENMILKFDVWGNKLKEILGFPSNEPRIFTYELKQCLFDSKNQQCDLCNQKIHSIDDAEVDHIECYSHGGKTIPENARLVHRYCNRRRGNLN